MVSHQVVAVDAKSSIYHLSDLKDKIIAVQSTTKPEMIFLKQEGNIPRVKSVYSFENREYIYTALGKGYVDAIAAHETAVEQYLKDFNADYRILKESILTTGLGVAFAKKISAASRQPCPKSLTVCEKTEEQKDIGAVCNKRRRISGGRCS